MDFIPCHMRFPFCITKCYLVVTFYQKDEEKQKQTVESIRCISEYFHEEVSVGAGIGGNLVNKKWIEENEESDHFWRDYVEAEPTGELQICTGKGL